MGYMKDKWIEQMEPKPDEWERRWIPVGERLPEPHEKVIALDDCGNPHIAAQQSFEEDAPFARGTRFHRFFSLWTNEWRAISGVTHWMALPEPPEVK